jgi:hypothetical protein
MNKSLIVILIGVAGFSSGVSAIDLGNDPSARDVDNVETHVGKNLPDFSQMDLDNSGYLNKDEASVRPGLSEHWEDFDQNEDGQLTRAEFSKFEEEDLEDRAKRLERAADKAEDSIDRAN